MLHQIRSAILITLGVTLTLTAPAIAAEAQPGLNSITAIGVKAVSPVVKLRTPHLHEREIRSFLSKTYVFDQETLDESAYIVGLQEDTLIADAGKLIYGRKLGEKSKKGKVYDIVRPEESYTDYETGQDIGIPARHLGTAVLLGGDDPKTLRIKTSNLEVKTGDRLVPATKSSMLRGVHPGAPRHKVSGHIIDIIDGVFEAGQYQVVAIDRGSKSGLMPGDILAVNSNSRRVIDENAERNEIENHGEPISPMVIYTPHDEFIENHEGQKRTFSGIKVDTIAEIVTLPEEAAGFIMVYRTFDNVSYALVTDAVRHLTIGNPVYNP